MQRKLNDCLVCESKKGKPVIVVIDEAQNLDENVLEVVRMLSNFETSREKLMHLVLAGQPRLAEMLASPKLEQLRQRISIIARLQPFNAEETRLYIDHRLRVAGYESDLGLFTKQALTLIVENSGGIPRNINNLCFNAMSLACAVKAKRIEADVVQEVIRDLRLDSNVENTPEGVKSEAKNAVLPRATKSSWLSGWHHKMAVPLSLLAVIGGSLTWRSLHSAQVIDPQKFPLQVGLAAASLPSSIALTEVSSVSPKEFPGTIAESPKAKTFAPPSISNLRTHPLDKSGLKSPSIVTVQPNQTMYRICIEALGRYDDATKTKIRELNPGLLNLTQIRPGQSIRLPARDVVRKNVRTSTEQEPIPANQAGNR
jgi:LysM repeat protein